VPDIAQILFLAFLALFLIALVGWLLFRRRAQSRLLGHRVAPRPRPL
jgi:cbb3-type cytochrome oxidase subunit 3